MGIETVWHTYDDCGFINVENVILVWLCISSKLVKVKILVRLRLFCNTKVAEDIRWAFRGQNVFE